MIDTHAAHCRMPRVSNTSVYNDSLRCWSSNGDRPAGTQLALSLSRELKDTSAIALPIANNTADWN